ncbi:MAG: M24 family metallopeptidase [Firmicutes bacterium]|nr:M24 family metallopeptidase [Bacillota bacterium]
MLRWQARLGLRGKLVLTYVALSVAAMGLTGAYVIASMDSFYHRRLVTDLQDEAALVAERTAPLLSAGRWAELQDYLAHMDERLTARAIVVDRNGVQVGSTEREDAARLGQVNDEPGVREALAGGEATGTYYSARAGAEVAYRAIPVRAADGSVAGAVRLSYRLSDVTAEMRQLYLTLGAGILAVGVVAVILGAALAARITQPVLALVQGVRAVAAGELSRRVPEDAPDELGELARMFNEMAARLERHEQARRELLAAQAHDLHALAAAMQAAADALVAALAAAGVTAGRVGIDEVGIAADVLEGVRARLGGVSFVPAARTWRAVRAVKTSEEIARLHRAARIVEDAIDAALRAARAGMTERAMARVFDEAVLAAGGQPLFAVIAFGAHAAYPNARPGERRLQVGDLIRFDVGCVYQGYCADLARTAVFGAPSPRQAAVYRALLAGLDAALATVRPGVSAQAVFEAAVAQARRAGLPHYRRHHVGHGVGLEIYDDPLLGPGQVTPLEAGMVLEVETPYYELGFGGLQVEDTVLVTDDGCRLLTESDRSLRQVG